MPPTQYSFLNCDATFQHSESFATKRCQFKTILSCLSNYYKKNLLNCTLLLTTCYCVGQRVIRMRVARCTRSVVFLGCSISRFDRFLGYYGLYSMQVHVNPSVTSLPDSRAHVRSAGSLLFWIASTIVHHLQSRCDLRSLNHRTLDCAS